MENRNVYKGHRYVPKIMGVWDQLKTYEGLSIVTWEGTSYTSKKRVPEGVDILDEDYWVVTGNYNAQVENYRQEVRDFDGRISDNESDIEDTNTQLERTTPLIYVEEFERLDLETDDTLRINRAIQSAHALGGGVVKLASKVYDISDSIHVLENVTLEGSHATDLHYHKIDGNVLIPYHKARITDLSVMAQIGPFEGTLLLLDSQYLRRNDRVDSLPASTTTSFERLRLFGTHPYATQLSTGIHLLADSSYTDGGSGLHGLTFRDITIRDAKHCILFETRNEGWLNGNFFENIHGNNAVNFIKTIRSEDSLGMAWNTIDKISFQVTAITRKVFDDQHSENRYTSVNVYDIHSHPNSKMGHAYNVVGLNGFTDRFKKTLLESLEENKYYYLGSFNRKDTSQNVTLHFQGGRLSIDTLINVSADKRVERKHKGNPTLTKDKLKFYIKNLDDGTADLYMWSKSTLTVTVNQEHENGFTASPHNVTRHDVQTDGIELITTDSTYYDLQYPILNDMAGNEYYTIGHFKHSSNNASVIYLRLRGGRLEIDTHIAISKNGVVERRHDGHKTLLEPSNLEVYFKDISEGRQVLLKINSSRTLDVFVTPDRHYAVNDLNRYSSQPSDLIEPTSDTTRE